jgi:hypothetical protein
MPNWVWGVAFLVAYVVDAMATAKTRGSQSPIHDDGGESMRHRVPPLMRISGNY